MQQIGQDKTNGNIDDDDLITMTKCVGDCGKRILSLLRGSVVVFVTSEDILMYIIIVYCCTPIGDVCYPFTGCHHCVWSLR